MKTKEVVLAGMFIAVLAVLSQISIPLPSGVPITLQTFGIALCGAVLGAKLGTISVLGYIFLGTLGVPVFSGMQGGAAVLFGKTGGFLWGFIFMVFLCGSAQGMKSKWLSGIIGLIGLMIAHLFGSIGFAILTNMGVWQSALLVSIPFLVKDIVSVFAAFAVGAVLRKHLSVANLLIISGKTKAE